MSPIRSRRVAPPLVHHQKGAIFLIMIAIITIGVIATLIGALSKVGLQNARNLSSSDLLVQAKETVIGYAVNGSGASQRPGDLMRPDVLSASESPSNYDGTSETGCLNATQPNTAPYSLTTNAANIRCIGRLPWKDYGLSIPSPSENDPLGVMPWYAVSSNLYDYPATPLNSELLNKQTGWLTVRDMNGNVLKDANGDSLKVAFVIIIPGAAINGQSRPASPLGSASQYLDSITVPAGCTAPCVPGTYSNADMRDEANTADNNFGFIMGEQRRWIDDPSNPGKQIEDSSYNFNDKLIYVTIDELMPLIEKRIAREVKSCLDSYAAVSANKYPWAAPLSPLGYTSTTNTKFGRIPNDPVISTTTTVPLTASSTSDANIQALFNALATLQTAVNGCLSANNTTTQNALDIAGNTLENIAKIVKNNQPTTPAISSTITGYAITAGDKAQDSGRCLKINNHTSTSVQDNLASANSGLNGITVTTTTLEDPAMQPAWSCALFNSSIYWDEWKSLVLYQVSDGYRPNNGVTASCGGTCLSISGSSNPNVGSGSYRAAVILPGKKISSQTRSAQTVNQYLEGSNTNSSSSLSFETYKPSDASYSTVNDLVLCVDGGINCK